MIGKILMCDTCGSSVGQDARPVRDGSQARKVANRGNIRRVRLGRQRFNSFRSRVVAFDLCRACNNSDNLERLRLAQVMYAERWGTTWEEQA